MSDYTALRAALAAGPTAGPLELCILTTPLDSIGDYVQECVNVSGGDDFYFVRAVRADGTAVDVAHFGNGPTSGVNGHWLTAADPQTIAALLAELDDARRDAERLRKAAEPALRELKFYIGCYGRSKSSFAAVDDFDAAMKGKP